MRSSISTNCGYEILLLQLSNNILWSLDELYQHTTSALRVDEGNIVPCSSFADSPRSKSNTLIR